MTNVLFAINEAAPLYKIGGLGDVGGSLPPALRHLGFDVRLILPKHPEINLSGKDYLVLESFTVVYDQHVLPMTIYQTMLPGTTVPLYLLEEKTYLSVHSNAGDNDADKYAVFSLGIATWISTTRFAWHPDLLHLNDWHTALVPVIGQHLLQMPSKTLITIHNLAYQGVTKTPVCRKLALPPNVCQILTWDQADGDTNILLEGLLHAQFITTVSPTYAREILTPEYGAGIEEILQTKASKIQGIVNGIDPDTFNPATDPHIDFPYTVESALSQKQLNKQALYRQLGLSGGGESTLISFIGRVDGRQKGIDLILESLQNHTLPPAGCRFIFLGTGEPQLESQLHTLATGNPDIAVITRFDEDIARRLYASADLILIPSRYEPCGLIQLIAMRYGTLPVARATGGLIDTIADGQTGYLFNEYTATAMIQALQTAINSIANPTTHQALVSGAMTQNFSWSRSAAQYAALYNQMTDH